jgi:hypothetical protein
MAILDSSTARMSFAATRPAKIINNDIIQLIVIDWTYITYQVELAVVTHHTIRHLLALRVEVEASHFGKIRLGHY